jgi:hypothetical protein
MAFNIANFAPGANCSKPIQSIASGALGVGAPMRHTYITEDIHATVDTSGYFNEGVAYKGVYNLLHIGDIIDVVVCSGGAISTYGPHIVMTKSAGVVNVSAVTVGTVTNSD